MKPFKRIMRYLQSSRPYDPSKPVFWIPPLQPGRNLSGPSELKVIRVGRKWVEMTLADTRTFKAEKHTMELEHPGYGHGPGYLVQDTAQYEIEYKCAVAVETIMLMLPRVSLDVLTKVQEIMLAGEGDG